MKTIFVYQIIDELSDSVLQTFMGANDRFAENVFRRFLLSDGMKNVDKSDLYLVNCGLVNVYTDSGDYDKTHDEFSSSIICYGSDLIGEVDESSCDNN